MSRLFEEFYRKMEIRYPDAAPKLLFHEALKRMLNALVNDLVVTTHRRVIGEWNSIAGGTCVMHAIGLHAFRGDGAAPPSRPSSIFLQELYHAHYLERDHTLAEEIIAGLFQTLDAASTSSCQ